jgi:hypothetical protein
MSGQCQDPTQVCCSSPLPAVNKVTGLSLHNKPPPIQSHQWPGCGVAAKNPGFGIKFHPDFIGAIPTIDFSPADPWEFPWTVVLLEKFKRRLPGTNETVAVYLAVGSLITPRFVMTTAHTLLKFK